MQFFIGGHHCSAQVDPKDENKNSICMLYGPRTGMERRKEIYQRLQISLNGTIKTFFVVSGENPANYKQQILALWDQVETDVYPI